jgi:hypothetical protein
VFDQVCLFRLEVSNFFYRNMHAAIFYRNMHYCNVQYLRMQYLEYCNVLYSFLLNQKQKGLDSMSIA